MLVPACIQSLGVIQKQERVAGGMAVAGCRAVGSYHLKYIHRLLALFLFACCPPARADAELQARGRHVAGRQDGDRRYVSHFFLK